MSDKIKDLNKKVIDTYKIESLYAFINKELREYNVGDIVYFSEARSTFLDAKKENLFVIIDSDKSIITFEYKENIFISTDSRNKLKYDSIIKILGTVSKDKIDYYKKLNQYIA